MGRGGGLLDYMAGWWHDVSHQSGRVLALAYWRLAVDLPDWDDVVASVAGHRVSIDDV